MGFREYLDAKMYGGGGGAKLLDHTVTFMADGQPYAISSVKSGERISAPVDEPTSESGSFTGWTYEGQKVEFPIQLPSEITNIELEASFKNARTEIEWNEAGLWFDYYQYGYKSVDKTGTGFCLVGHISMSSGVAGVYTVLVSDNPNSIATPSPATKTFVYNDITYYYKYNRIDLSQFNSITSHSINLEEYYEGTNYVELSKTLLDYYFRKIGN